MTVYNVLVPVSARLRADDPSAAIRELTDALTAAGFDVYEEGINLSDAFVDEDQKTVDTLPVPRPLLSNGGTDEGSDRA
jgi:hypothetical protein